MGKEHFSSDGHVAFQLLRPPLHCQRASTLTDEVDRTSAETESFGNRGSVHNVRKIVAAALAGLLAGVVGTLGYYSLNPTSDDLSDVPTIVFPSSDAGSDSYQLIPDPDFSEVDGGKNLKQNKSKK